MPLDGDEGKHEHLRTCACLLAALLMAGCAATGGQAPVTGHLAGRLVMEGGPMGPGGQQPGSGPSLAQ